MVILDHVEGRQTVIRWLEEQDVKIVGKWGQWHYWNMDKVYDNVLETINNITFRL
jgi:UDP-galactopyranose mutase